MHSIQTISSSIPWQAKIIAKLILSRLPFGYQFWRNIGFFMHGDMEQPSYAYNVFKNHFDRVEFTRKKCGFVSLEMGPGDSLFSALIARAFGSSSSYLIDTGRYAREDVVPYQRMGNYLSQRGLNTPDLELMYRLDDILAACSAHYGSEGIQSLRAIPDGTVDFVWSQAVLEHIRKDEFLDTMRELRRVLRLDGVCSHRIDLQDHLSGALNNLRFSKKLWESDFMSRSGFYTNRIRFSEMLDYFKKTGFDADVIGIDRWDNLPTPRSSFSYEFSSLPDDDLRIYAFDVILRPTMSRVEI